MRRRLPQAERGAFGVTHRRDTGHALDVLLVDERGAKFRCVGDRHLDVLATRTCGTHSSLPVSMRWMLATVLPSCLRKVWLGAATWAVHPTSGP